MSVPVKIVRQPRPVAEDAVQKIAMDVGQQVVDYIDSTFPEAYQGVWSPRSFRLSIRNVVRRAIMEAVEAADDGKIDEMLTRHDKHRRTMRKLRRMAGQEF